MSTWGDIVKQGYASVLKGESIDMTPLPNGVPVGYYNKARDFRDWYQNETGRSVPFGMFVPGTLPKDVYPEQEQLAGYYWPDQHGTKANVGVSTQKINDGGTLPHEYGHDFEYNFGYDEDLLFNMTPWWYRSSKDKLGGPVYGQGLQALYENRDNPAYRQQYMNKDEKYWDLIRELSEVGEENEFPFKGKLSGVEKTQKARMSKYTEDIPPPLLDAGNLRVKPGVWDLAVREEAQKYVDAENPWRETYWARAKSTANKQREKDIIRELSKYWTTQRLGNKVAEKE